MYLFDRSTHSYLGFVDAPKMCPGAPGFALAPHSIATKVGISKIQPNLTPLPTVIVTFYPPGQRAIGVVSSGREFLPYCDRFLPPDPHDECELTWREAMRIWGTND